MDARFPVFRSGRSSTTACHPPDLRWTFCDCPCSRSGRRPWVRLGNSFPGRPVDRSGPSRAGNGATPGRLRGHGKGCGTSSDRLPHQLRIDPQELQSLRLQFGKPTRLRSRHSSSPLTPRSAVLCTETRVKVHAPIERHAHQFVGVGAVSGATTAVAIISAQSR